MQYQRAPLPPDIEYFLDCANEEDAINSFDHAVLTLLGDRKTVMEIVDNEGGAGRTWRARWSICARLDAYAHDLVSDLPRHEQVSFAAAGLRWEPLHLLRIAEYLAHFNFEDETRGGANLPFRRTWRCDDNYDPTPRARRRLYAPAAIHRFTKREDQSIPHSQILAARLRRLPASQPADLELVTTLANEQRETYKATYVAARAKFEAERRKRYAWAFEQPDRRMIRRAARFCAGLIGSGQVSAFASGQAVALPGRDIILEIARNRSIGTVGHGALDVRLCAPDGTRLANICVYFEKTPALDQLAAIAMHVGAGDESSIIETGNLFNITKAGAEHPIVQARMARKPTADMQALIDRIERRGVGASEHDRQMAALRRYKAGTIEIYVKAVRDRVWGRDAKRLDPFIDALMEAAIGDIQEMAEAA